MIFREEKCQNSQFAQTRAMALEIKSRLRCSHSKRCRAFPICGLKKTPAGTGLDWKETGGDFCGGLS